MKTPSTAPGSELPWYRWRLKNAVAAVVLSASLVPAAAFSAEPSLEPVPDRAQSYEDLFNRAGKSFGVSGADGANSVRLPNGHDLWFFGDSEITKLTVDAGVATKAEGTFGDGGIVHKPRFWAWGQSVWVNNAVVDTYVPNPDSGITPTYESRFKSIAAEAGKRLPTEYFTAPPKPDSATNAFFWPGNSHVEGTNVRVFVQRYHYSAAAGQQYIGNEIHTIPVSEASNPNFSSTVITQVPDTYWADYSIAEPEAGKISWGRRTMNNFWDNKTYIYGMWQGDVTKRIKTFVARCEIGKLTDVASWTYYAGNGSWQPQGSIIITPGIPIMDEYPDHVVQWNFSIIFLKAFGKEITARAVRYPWGTLSGGRVDSSPPVWKYVMPETLVTGLNKATGVPDSNVFPFVGYLAHAHPSIADPANSNRRLVSYSINSYVPAQVAGPATYYRPHFLWVDFAGISALRVDN